MYAATVGVAGAGTATYSPDVDVFFLGATCSSSAAVTISTDPSLTAASVPTSASDILQRISTNSYNNFAVKLPVPAGSKIFAVFSAAGFVVMYFETAET